MAEREWKPGDVAMVRWKHFPAAVAIFNGATRQWEDSDGAVFDGHEDEVTIRPLVVIDPEDREQVERLRKVLSDSGAFTGLTKGNVSKIQATLREFADPKPPKPPKPEEPTGLGAVVEDVDGETWVQRHNGQWLNFRHFPRDYSDIDAVRVLSEGVTA